MKLKITVDGKSYEVEVEVADEAASSPILGGSRVSQNAPSSGPPRNHAAASASPKQPSNNVEDDKAIKSPLAGNVSEVKVVVGEEVSADKPVLVLEAMKMLTTITAPIAGKVSSIEVSVGDAVKQNQVLIALE